MTSPLNLEEVDLAVVAYGIRKLVDAPIEGSIVGRTRLRDAVVEHLDCSQLEAEQIVDTMIGRGFLVETEVADGRSLWEIRTARG